MKFYSVTILVLTFEFLTGVIVAQNNNCDYKYFEEKKINNQCNVKKSIAVQKFSSIGINFSKYNNFYIESCGEEGRFFFLRIAAEKKDTVFTFFLTGKDGCFTKKYFCQASYINTKFKNKPIFLNRFFVYLYLNIV